MKDNNFYGGRDIHGKLLPYELHVEPETVRLELSAGEEEHDKKEATA